MSFYRQDETLFQRGVCKEEKYVFMLFCLKNNYSIRVEAYFVEAEAELSVAIEAK